MIFLEDSRLFMVSMTLLIPTNLLAPIHERKGRRVRGVRDDGGGSSGSYVALLAALRDRCCRKPIHITHHP